MNHPGQIIRLVSALLLGAVVLSGGCSSYDKEEDDRWSADRWKEALVEDRQRAKTEDDREAFSAAWPLQKAADGIGDFFSRAWNLLTGHTPFDAAKAMIDPNSADRRREAVVYFADREYGRKAPYVDYYAEMARSDLDPTVKAMAIRALNRARARQHSQIYIPSLKDTNEQVRLEAVKALANMPDDAAADALVRVLNNVEESTDVRVAAADALRGYKNVQVAQALARALMDRQFGVAWQARKSLKLMTGKDYRYDQAGWLTYLSGAEKPFG